MSRRQNRVALSALPPDEHGPIARVEMHHRARSARTAANRQFLVGQALELVRAAGNGEVPHQLAACTRAIHSTLRMGSRSSDSVLDEHAEARAVRRLFVADNSALPNSLGGANPTLTTQALATRTAERIIQRYFDGHDWVTKVQPTSSISPSVTAAVVRLGDGNG